VNELGAAAGEQSRRRARTIGTTVSALAGVARAAIISTLGPIRKRDCAAGAAVGKSGRMRPGDGRRRRESGESSDSSGV
jgi:hypothetical protein